MTAPQNIGADDPNDGSHLGFLEPRVHVGQVNRQELGRGQVDTGET